MNLPDLLQYLVHGTLVPDLVRLWIFSSGALLLILLVFFVFRTSATTRVYALAALPWLISWTAIQLKILVPSEGPLIQSPVVANLLFVLRAMLLFVVVLAFLAVLALFCWDLFVADRQAKRTWSAWRSTIGFDYALPELETPDPREYFSRLHTRLSDYKRAHYAFVSACPDLGLSRVRCTVTQASRKPSVFWRMVNLPPQTALAPSRILRTHIRHELCHIQGNHFWINIFAVFPLILTPLNWPLWISFWLFRRETEASCDDAASQLDGRDTYARILESSLPTLSAAQPRARSLLLPLSQSWQWRKRRLRNARIRHAVPQRAAIQVLTCALAIQAAAIFLSMVGTWSRQATVYIKDESGRTHRVREIAFSRVDTDQWWHLPLPVIEECMCCNRNSYRRYANVLKR